MKLDMESRIRSSMGKQAYYDTFEINQLLSDIEESAKTLESREPDSWKNQQDAQKFCDLIEIEVYEIAFMNKNDLSIFYEWYKPDGKWDEITNGECRESRDVIFDRLKIWKAYYD